MKQLLTEHRNKRNARAVTSEMLLEDLDGGQASRKSNPLKRLRGCQDCQELLVKVNDLEMTKSWKLLDGVDIWQYQLQYRLDLLHKLTRWMEIDG